MSHTSQFGLLKQRRFSPFFWTQFCGAANDNVFKVAFTALVTFQTALFPGVDGKTAAFVISAIFILPFVLFSATSGQLSDKYDKARVMRLVKSLEIAIMVIGGAGFLLHDIWLLYAGTFLMGVHSTLFGPVKYAYLPQHLNEHELVGGNGMIEMGTFVAILVGTIVGGELADLGRFGPDAGPVAVAAVCLGVAVVGRIVVSFVPASPSDQPDLKINWNPFTETWRNLGLARENRAVFLSLLGISWLWFFGATFLTSFFNFAKDVLGGDPQVVTLLLAIFSIGIGFGSLMCEKLSRGKVEIGLVPLGSIGMTVFAVDLYFASHALAPGPSLVGVAAFLAEPGQRFAHWHVMADLFLLAMFGGLYSVPLYAMIQSRSQPSHRARIIAANNILNSLFMIVSSIMAIGLFALGCTIPQLFLVVGILNAVVAIYIYSLVPEFLIRFLAWVLISTFYRIRTTGSEHVPADGPALLVCNHVSFVDAIVILGELPRPVRFVMDLAMFRAPVLGFLFKSIGAIGIVPAKDDSRMFDKANALIDEALRQGELVCIFPEGRITDTGEMYPFKQGAVRIAQRNHVPVIPMALRGLWGSWTSRKSGHAFAALPRPLKQGLSTELELAVGSSLASETVTLEGLQADVGRLRGAWK